MFKLFTILVALFVGITASALPEQTDLECGEVFTSEAGKLKAAGWTPMGLADAPFFILLMQNSLGQYGAVIVVPQPYASPLYREVQGNPQSEVKVEKMCIEEGTPFLFLVVTEVQQKA